MTQNPRLNKFDKKVIMQTQNRLCKGKVDLQSCETVSKLRDFSHDVRISGVFKFDVNAMFCVRIINDNENTDGWEKKRKQIYGLYKTGEGKEDRRR